MISVWILEQGACNGAYGAMQEIRAVCTTQTLAELAADAPLHHVSWERWNLIDDDAVRRGWGHQRRYCETMEHYQEIHGRRVIVE